MTKLLRSATAIAVAALAAFAPSARAAEPAYDYALVRAGTFLAQSPSLPNYDAGLDGEIAIGRAFLNFLAGELSVGYFRASGARTWFYPDPVSYNVVVDMTTRISVVPVTGSVKLMLPVGSIQPYLVGGAGLYFATLTLDPADARATLSESRTTVGFHAGAGATFRLGERYFGGVDARYAFVTTSEYFHSGTGLTLDGVRVGGLFGIRF